MIVKYSEIVMARPFTTKRFIVLTPNGKSMINAIGENQTQAYENAAFELGNKNTVDKLKAFGYSCIQVQITELE